MARGIGTAVTSLLAAAALAGCVSMPAGGGVSVNSFGGSSVQVGQGLQVVPAPPATGWSPAQIVAGFLAASGASLTGSSATGTGVSSSSFDVARLYLSRKFRQDWHPGSSATVIDAVPNIRLRPNAQRNIQPPAAAYVDVTSQHVEILQSPGNIVVSPKSHVYLFDLVQEAGQWRIDGINADGSPDSGLLLLLRPDFQRDYQPRDLYFFPMTGPATTLVPDPVFVPQQQGTLGSVRALVAGLLRPAGWLQGAVTTAFPRKTTINVQVSGVKAIVDLGGAALRASPAQVQEMTAQLVYTLAGPPGSPNGTGIELVQVRVGRRGPDLELPARFTGYMSAWTPSANLGTLYFQPADPGGPPRLAEISQPGRTVQVPLPRATGTGPFTAIAGFAAGSPSGILAACRAKFVYLMPARRTVAASTVRLPAPCTSLAFDDRGDLWATAGSGAYVLPPVSAAAGTVRHGVFTEALAEPGRLSGLTVAPDGVRVAMIEQTRAGGQILVAAISKLPYGNQFYLGGPNEQTVRIGSDITYPVALAWHYGDLDHLLVVGRQASGEQQLFSVPLNGGDSVVLPNPLPPSIVALQGMRQEVIVGTAPVPGSEPAGEIFVSFSLQNGAWHRLAAGSTPVLPG